MRPSRLLLPAATALLLAACAGRPATRPAARVVWTMHDLRRAWNADSADTAKDVWVSLYYPQFTAAPGRAAVDSLNAWVESVLFAPAGSESAATLESLAADFIESYRRFKLDFPESRLAGWFYENEIRVTWDSLGLVSMVSSADSYTGGAHGAQIRTWGVLDARSGRRLGIPDLVGPEHRDSLERLGEAAFRAMRGLAAEAPLDSLGFMFPGGRFGLNRNFGLDRDGLVFHFNPYEVGPYAIGPTEVRLDWDLVRPLLRGNGPLAALRREPLAAAAPSR